MATSSEAPKKKRKASAAQATSQAKEADLDLSADELVGSNERPNADNAQLSINLITEMRATMESLRKSHSDVNDRLAEFRVRIDKGEVSDYQWRKPGLQKQYASINSFLVHFESAKVQIAHGNYTIFSISIPASH